MFTHPKSDLASFRLFTSQLIVQGSATQERIAKAFGVPLVAMKRSTKRYRERGAAGFFRPKARREGSKLKAETLEQARALLRRVLLTPANLRPDYESQTLVVQLHRLGSPLQDAAVAKLCEHLNQTQTAFPTTGLRLIYRQIGSN